MNPASPLPHHRHQSSLEGIISFSPTPAFDAAERTVARRRFYRIINHFQDANESCHSQYSRPVLIRLTYEYARSEESRDLFLRAFFKSIGLPVISDNDSDFANKEGLSSAIAIFADYLIDNFFLPCECQHGS